jgi:hypothetical protein
VPAPRRSPDIFGVAILAALVALAVAFGAQRGKRAVQVAARAGEGTELVGPIARYSFFPTSGRIGIASADGRSRLDVELSLLVDGTERPLVMRKSDVSKRDKSLLVASFPIEVGDERSSGTLELRMDTASDILDASLSILQEPGSAAHTYALRAGLSTEGRPVFVPGVGELTDVGTIDARTVVVDDDAHPFAFLSNQGVLGVQESPPEIDTPGARPRLVVTSKLEHAQQRAAGATGKPTKVNLGIVVGASSQLVWGRLYKLARVNVARVSGVVTGTRERAHVVALDEDGRPQLRAVVDAQGRFVIEAPTNAMQWYAALEAAHTSAPVRYAPGSPWELKLDVSPGGELHVRVVDADTGQPLVARLLVKGLAGTIDPTFGPDYRASGAGPLMDVLEGEVTTPLPAGKYRVAATKGIEWSIDAEILDIQSGHTKSIDLALRHVVPTPGVVSCDLHVHARPSFDSPVTPEDRVLSLVSAGIDFAVPTEHNIVGDYGPALEVLKLGKQLAHTTGVEITTYNPRFGHFGVFPYPTGAGVPPFKGTTAGAMFAAAKRGDPNRVVQVNHPRLPMGIGYFSIVNFDPKTGRLPGNLRTDFDTLEVYNGYELARRELTERVMEDWFALLNFGKRIAATGSSDSHRIQYQWAGYPRTMALVDPRAAGDTGAAVDPAAVVAAIKKGRSYVTTGPAIELELTSEGRTAKPGDDLPVARGAPIGGRLRVRAAPWVDVTSVEVIAGIPAGTGAGGAPQAGSTTSILKKAVTSRPTQMGREEGTKEESAARTVRYDGELSLTVPDNARWIVVVVRGERPLDDALPFMPIQPLAFTNPIWLTR